MTVGFITPTVGCFGAVREMVEVSNFLVRQGHDVVIYHPEGGPCLWLECLASCRSLGTIHTNSLDVLIGIVDWQPDLYDNLIEAKASVKAICLLGFDPTEDMAKALRKEIKPKDKAQRIIIDAMQKNFLLLADSNWQVDWIKQITGYSAGPAFGGVNLKMFHPSAIPSTRESLKIIYSGDPRSRKGTDTVKKAIKILNLDFPDIEFDFYWGKKLSQKNLVEFIQDSDIFLDAHRRAGWCNPVAEAIACGTVPVCSDIGAVQDFAIHNKTALVVPVDNAEEMAYSASKLIVDEELRSTLRQNGLNHIKNFSYENIVPQLERVLEQKIRA